MTEQKPIKRAVAYSRCSTDEHRQDVENQLKELRRYCQAHDWAFDEVAEYGSGYKEAQPKLQAVLERVRKGHYQVFVTFSLDRFSRQHPSKVNALLDQIVYQYGCRFISIQESLDSQNELIWQVIKPLFSWFAHAYSRNLSEKIRLGIQTKREKGDYRGGRPPKTIDVERLKSLRLCSNDFGWRRLTWAYNQGLSEKGRVSVSLLRRVCQKLSFESKAEKASKA